MEYEKLNIDWNADPNSPEPTVLIENSVLKVVFFLNYFNNNQFKEGERAQLTFENCSKYSFNSCNDEGYYRGQYRINQTEIPWGEFYRIISGVDREIPEPIIELSDFAEFQNHYIFFFRDNTLELFAERYKLEFLKDSKIQ